MSFPKLSWGREKHDLADRWPKGPDGTLGKVLFGTPSGGVGLYVPESMLEDARNLLAPVEESTRNEEES